MSVRCLTNGAGLRFTPELFMSAIGMSALGQKRTCAMQNVMSAFPPIADMCSAQADVRFVPIADIAAHSIISSASARIDVGNTIPKLFAVFRLITSSNFVGSSAGSSAGLEPFNTLATSDEP